jgi:beta-carotene 3-hydroxylase
MITFSSFGAMEAVSYATHRWLMHGPGMAWHRSHHLPPRGRIEKNDRFPLLFAAISVAGFAAASRRPTLRPVGWGAAGMALYGAAYLYVHEVIIHRRLPSREPRTRYVRWLRDSHRAHHAFAGEPYGMLLPLVSRASRQEARTTRRDALDRTTRSARSRL